MSSKKQKATRECPFPECDWTYRYHSSDYSSSTQADYQSDMHYEKEHAGRVEIQVTLEKTQLIGAREVDDIREQQFEREFLGWEIAHVRTNVKQEADDHSVLSEDTS